MHEPNESEKFSKYVFEAWKTVVLVNYVESTAQVGWVALINDSHSGE